MIGAHFASSAFFDQSAACAGVLPGVGSMPASCRRLKTTGSASALFTASLSRSTIGCGVPGRCEDCVPGIALETLQALLLQRRQLRHCPHARRHARTDRGVFGA